MTRVLQLLLLFALGLLSTSGALAQTIFTTCTPHIQEKVRECADPLYRTGALTDASEFSWQLLLTKTRQYIHDVCDNFFIFDLCIEQYKDACFGSENARYRYNTALQVLDFVCRDGYGEMMRNFECFTKTLTRAEMMQCQAEMVADTKKIPSDGEGSRNATACGAMKNYVDCVRYPIRYECGYRAWMLVRELIVRPTEALLPGCQLSSTSLLFTWVPIIFAMFLFSL